MSTKTEDALKSYYFFAKSNILLYDKRMHLLHATGKSYFSFCCALNGSQSAGSQCLAFDNEAFAQISRTGQTTSFTCPFGVRCTMAPVISHGELLGCLYTSHGIADSPEALLHSALEKVGDEVAKEDLQRGLLDMPRYTEQELEELRLLTDAYASHVARIGLPCDRPKGVAELTEEFLCHHFQEKITLRTIGIHLHYSTVTLTESFRKAYGCTIMGRLNEIRLGEAERLLRVSAMSISEIAEQCGFGSIEYFSKCFKRRHGLPPGEWRKKQQ